MRLTEVFKNILNKFIHRNPKKEPEGIQIATEPIVEPEEAQKKKTKRNELRDRLLQSYRYYTSKDKNPLLAWSVMESDAFWKMFGDYEEAGGDGDMHTTVQPAMRLLDVIQMNEEERISELMQSRK